MVGYVLTPLGQQMRSHDSATPQLSQQVNEVADRGTLREGRVYLPGTLQGGKEELLGPAPAGPPALQCTGACLVRSAAAAGVFPACRAIRACASLLGAFEVTQGAGDGAVTKTDSGTPHRA